MLIKNTGAKVRIFLIEHTYTRSFFYFLLFAIRLICYTLVIDSDQDNFPDLVVYLYPKINILSLCIGQNALYLCYKCNTLIL